MGCPRQCHLPAHPAPSISLQVRQRRLTCSPLPSVKAALLSFHKRMQACPLPMHQAMTFCVIEALHTPKCLPGLNPCASNPAARMALPSLIGCIPWACKTVLPVEPAPPTGDCPVEPSVHQTSHRSTVLCRGKLCNIASQPYGQAYQEAYQTGNLGTLSVDEAQDRSAWHFSHGRPAGADEVPPSVVLARQAAKVGWCLCGQA